MSAYQYPAAAPPAAPAADPTAVMGRRIGAIVVDFVLFMLLSAFLAPTPLSPLAEYYEVPGIESSACDRLTEDSDITGCLVIGDRVYVTDSGDAAVQTVVMLLALVLYVIVQGVSGATPGKALFGVRAVDEQGGKPGFGRSLGRTLLWIIDAAPWCLPLVGLVTGLSTTGHRRVGDMAVKTFVVRSGHSGPVVVPGLTTAPPAGPQWGAPPPTGPGQWGTPAGAPPGQWGAPSGANPVPPQAAPPQSGQQWGAPAPTAWGPPGAGAAGAAGAAPPPSGWAAPGADAPASTPSGEHPAPVEAPTPTPSSGADRAEAPEPGEPTPAQAGSDSDAPPAGDPGAPPSATAPADAPAPSPDRPAPPAAWAAPVSGPAGPATVGEREQDDSPTAPPPGDAAPAAAGEGGTTPAGTPGDARGEESAETLADDMSPTPGTSPDAPGTTGDDDATAVSPTADDATRVEPGRTDDTRAWGRPDAAGAAGATQPAQSQPAQSQPGYSPQWDAARGTYIVWEPNRAAWLGWDDTAKEWRPL